MAARYGSSTVGAYGGARAKVQKTAQRQKQYQYGSVNQRNSSANARAEALAQKQRQHQQQLQAKPVPLASGGPAAPAAPAAPGYQPQALPFDAGYEGSMANAALSRDNSLAQASYNESATRREFGFDDPSDPFNRAAMLQKAYTERQAQTLNGAGNNLYSSAQNAQVSQDRFGYDQNVNAARTQYGSALQNIQAQRAQAQTEYGSASTGALADAIARAAGTRPDDPGVLPPAPGAPAPAKAVAKKATPVYKLPASQQSQYASQKAKEAKARADAETARQRALKAKKKKR